MLRRSLFCEGRRIRIHEGHQAADVADPGAEPLGVSLYLASQICLYITVFGSDIESVGDQIKGQILSVQ